MAYVNRPTTLGLAPAAIIGGISAGKKLFGGLFGGSSPKQTYPWRWEKIAGQPNHLGIKYGTSHRWFIVWSGPIDQIFTPGFDVSGSTDRGKWRAVNDAGTLRVYEFVNDRWYETFSGSEGAIKAWTGYRSRVSTTADAVTAAFAPAQIGDTVSSAMPWLIGAGILTLGLMKFKG